MGHASRGPRRAARIDSADRDGDARLRRSKDSRGIPETEAELLSREPPLQQLVVHVKGCAAPRVGVPGALRKQAHRRTRSSSAHPRADEPAERTRLADVARLSAAHASVIESATPADPRLLGASQEGQPIPPRLTK